MVLDELAKILKSNMAAEVIVDDVELFSTVVFASDTNLIEGTYELCQCVQVH